MLMYLSNARGKREFRLPNYIERKPEEGELAGDEGLEGEPVSCEREEPVHFQTVGQFRK